LTSPDLADLRILDRALEPVARAHRAILQFLREPALISWVFPVLHDHAGVLRNGTSARAAALSADRRAGEPFGHHPIAGEGRADGGVKVFEDPPVTRVIVENRQTRGVETPSWVVERERVICCARSWMRNLAGSVGVKQLMNGPKSFTPDGNIILGEAPNDLWPVDIRRFGKVHQSTDWVRTRVLEPYGKHYTIAWPSEEMQSARPTRRLALYAGGGRAGAAQCGLSGD